LFQEFSQYGHVISATVVKDKKTGRSKGYGFVTFGTAAACQKSLSNPEKIIDGRKTLSKLAALGAESDRYGIPPDGSTVYPVCYAPQGQQGNPYQTSDTPFQQTPVTPSGALPTIQLDHSQQRTLLQHLATPNMANIAQVHLLQTSPVLTPWVGGTGAATSCNWQPLHQAYNQAVQQGYQVTQPVQQLRQTYPSYSSVMQAVPLSGSLTPNHNQKKQSVGKQ